MIVSAFKDSNPIGYLIAILMLGLALVVWGHFEVMIDPSGSMPLYLVLTSVFAYLPGWCVGCLVFLLIGSQAYHWNTVAANHEVLYKKSLLPLLLFIVFAASLPVFLSINPVLPVISLTIIILDKLFKIYKNPNPLSLVFDAAFLAGVSCLFWFPSILLVPFLLLAVVILKPINLRDIIVLIIGFCTPLFLAFVCLYFLDRGPVGEILFPFSHLEFQLNPIEIMQKEGFFISMVIVTMILSAWRINRNFYKNATRVRIYQQTVFLLLIFIMVGVWASGKDHGYGYYFMSIPFATMVPYYFLAGKKKWWSEMYFLIIVICLLASQTGLTF
ncbi:MAG: DUF6427 family protein [Bacteroidota bacterium]